MNRIKNTNILYVRKPFLKKTAGQVAIYPYRAISNQLMLYVDFEYGSYYIQQDKSINVLQMCVKCVLSESKEGKGK